MGRARRIPPKFKALVYLKQAVVRRVVARKVYALSRLVIAMPSFREIRDLLLLLHGSNLFWKRNFFFYEKFQSANLSFPHSSNRLSSSVTLGEIPLAFSSFLMFSKYFALIPSYFSRTPL